jgi:16S rRNA (cytosine967-C5)-methyltransferase
MAQTQARLKRYAYAEGVRCAVVDAAVAVRGEHPTLRKGAKDGAPAVVAGEFDLILCDVPCSGTGTLAGNPEIRHRLKVEELTRQAERQRAILAGALKRLAVGGRLVYSTCSLEAEECERVVESVSGVRRVAVDGLMEGLAQRRVLREGVEWRSMVRDGALRTLPGVHGCDGFFAVVLERVAGWGELVG